MYKDIKDDLIQINKRQNKIDKLIDKQFKLINEMKDTDKNANEELHKEPMLKIELDDIYSVPRVYYKGKHINKNNKKETTLSNLKLDWGVDKTFSKIYIEYLDDTLMLQKIETGAEDVKGETL